MVPEVNMMRASSVQEGATPCGSASGPSISAARGSHGSEGSGPAPSPPVGTTIDPLQPRQLAGDQGEPVEVGVRDHQPARLDEVDRPGQEVALVGRVDRAHHGPGLEDAVPGRHELLAVGKQDAHRLARAHAAGDQAVGHPVGPRVDLAVAEPGPVGEAQVVAVGVLLGAAPQDLGEDPRASGPRARTSRSSRPSAPPSHAGSGPWPSRNLRQSAGRFSWKEAMPSLGSGPWTWFRAISSIP